LFWEKRRAGPTFHRCELCLKQRCSSATALSKNGITMTILAAADPTAVLFWCGATGVLLMSAMGSFFAGVLSAPWLQEWAVRRASAEIHKMYGLVIAEVERAQRLCAQLASASGCVLSAEEWQRMDRVQRDFQETFSQIAKSCGIEPPVQEREQQKARPRDFAVEWIKTPVDSASGLPDKRAFDQNLAAMLGQGAQTRLESGLLLIRMDKAEGLRRRLGNGAVEKLLSRLISLVVRTARDQDLICRLSPDTLGLLCPAMPPLFGTKMAEKIRDAVRNYHFRAEDGGPEVLVTASFGYANCGPADSPDLVLDRAEDALARSQSLGRNQLHVHDGQARALCRT
jgi:diguanylate cyclase (GGDEF)-like protein